MKKVLYIGSGASISEISSLDLSNFIVVCCNNSHRLIDKKFDYWVFSGDYQGPKPDKSKCTFISSREYEPVIKNLLSSDKAIFDVGYTIFLQGLYWIMGSLKPDEIYLLGFDHDYNDDVLKKWEEMGKPTPQNNKNLKKWLSLGYKTSFYGPSTPDPMRFGKEYLIQKFNFAIKISDKLNIKLFNTSRKERTLLPFKRKKLRKLTIGFVVYDDWNGFYFSIQAIRMYHKEVLEDIEFVVINTNPSSIEGKQVADFCKSKSITEPLHYFEDDNKKGGFTKEKVFEYAKTEYVMVMDCHCLLQQESLSNLIGFFDSNLDQSGLVHGPMIWDDMKSLSTNLKRAWGSGMLGQWETKTINEPYFEIDAQGMGLFACRKSSWLGFTKNNSGFGGEEFCIHDKFKQQNKKVFCLSSLVWLHRFGRPNGVPYPNKWEDRVKNYFRSYLELDKPIFEIIEHFKTMGLSESLLREWLLHVIKENE